jgi:hypothetical protein
MSWMRSEARVAFLRSMVRTAAVIATAVIAMGARAQEPWRIGVRGHYGFLWAHRPSSWILVDAHAGAAEAFAERRVEGDKPWQQAFGRPVYGLAVLHTRMGNPARIGESLALMPYLDMRLCEHGRWRFGLRMGWGAGYVAKPYDRRENTRQIAIGSHVNTAIQLMPHLAWQGRRLVLSVGLAVDHWSNGSFKQPNLGLNFLSAALGCSWALGPQPLSVPPVDSLAYERPRREFAVMGALGASESGRPLNGQRLVGVVTADASWRRGRKGAWGVGIDVFNKGDLATLHAELADTPRIALTQAGVHAGGSLLMGRGELLFQFGAYVYSPVPDDANVYQRLGARYRFGRHVLAGLALKTHFATADHWELGIGYRW